MVEPDPLKIKYREALIQAVQFVVREAKRPTSALVGRLAAKFAEKADRDAFACLLKAALQQLHEGSVARYRLERSEYLAWEKIQSAAFR